VARVVAFVPDLLFGSNLIGALQAGGHDPVLVSSTADIEGALAGADVLVVDLTAEVDARLAAVTPLLGTVATLAFYAHVEAEVKVLATSAGVDLVVPRSRMARAGSELVDQLVER